MKASRFVKVFSVAAVLALALCVLAGCDNNSKSDDYTLVNDGKLTVAMSPDYPPFENLENGEYVGYDVELGKALAEQLGLEYEPTTIQFDGLLPALESGGQCDVVISGMTVTPERQEQADFTEAYYVDDQAVVVMKDSGYTTDNVSDELNQKGKVIAVQSGTTGEDFAKENFPNATIVGYGNATDSFAALQSGNADAVWTNAIVADRMVSSSFTDCEVVKTVATGEEYAVAVSKDNPALTEALNNAIAKLKEDGVLDQLQVDYLG